MYYILRIDTRYRNWPASPAKFYAITSGTEAISKMTEELEKLNRQIMATELTDVTGYTFDLKKWISGNNYKKVAWIDYDLAL